MGDDRDTQASEAALASEDTVDADSPDSGSAPSGPVIRRSTPKNIKVGRFEVVRLRGRGGMGEVYEADDPQLGRRVAIKVLREGKGGTASLLREAQALAKLVHPNVITVHDVGSTEGSVFLVMQLVDGESIDQWLRAREASPRAIIAAFRDAGLGLAAAHAAGLVHCDFKPSNVLVDQQGVVRVGDFGLARSAGDEGEIAGTPAYMAPEQFGGRASAASDQFSFCVALWEMLAGERPFAPVSMEQGAKTAATRALRPMPRGRRVPGRVVRALERGLSADPEQRFPAMQPLLDQLAPRGRRGLAIGGVAAAVGATIAIVASLRGSTAPPAAVALKPPQLDRKHLRSLTSYGDRGCAYAPTVTAGGDVVFDLTAHDAVDLYKVPLAGGTPHQLTSGPAWEWRSSRGRSPGEILFLIHGQGDDKQAAIATIDLATGKQATLIPQFAQDAGAGGDSVFYVPPGQNQLRRWKAGQDTTIVDAGARRIETIAVSPNGDRAAAIAGDGSSRQLCLIDVPAGKLECSKEHVVTARPAFGADGRNVYFLAGDGIRRRDLETGHEELMLPDADAWGGISLAPDGSALVFSTCGEQSQLVDAGDAHPVIADRTVSDPAVAADGSLAFTRDQHGVRTLVVRTKDGREQQLTGPELGSVRAPSFSPNGSHVAFVAGAPHAGVHVASVGPTGSVARITDGALDTFPQWLDDEHVAFTRLDDAQIGSIYIVASDGGGLHRVGPPTRQLIGARGGKLLAESPEHLVWIDSKSGTERPGPEKPTELVFATLSPGGRWFAYLTGTTGQEIWRVAVDRGKPERVGSLPSGQAATSIAVTDDGHVLYAHETWAGDLIAVPAVDGAKL